MAKRKTDKALERAWELLDRVVCECGHLDGDHVFDTAGRTLCCHGDDGELCECREFQDVIFSIERAD